MAKGDISGSPFCVSPDVLCMERTGDDECAYSDASSEEDDQLDVLESEDLVPASSSPVSSSPAAMTPSDTSSGELVPVIYNRHETSSQTLSSVDTGGMHDLAFESFSDDEEKVTALLEVEDHPESRTSLDTRPESQNQSAAVALADVDISTGFLRLTPLLSSPTQSSFVVRLNELLQAVQEERRQAESRRRLRLQDNGTGTPPAPDDPSIASTPASDSASDIDARVNSGPNNENATSARACSVSHSVSSSRSGESISGDPSYSHFKTSRSSSSDYWACFRSPGEILIRGASEHDGCDGTRHDIEDMCTTLPAYTHVPNSITIKEEESTPSITVILPTFKSQPRMKTMQGFVVASRPQIKHTLPTKRQSSCAPTPIAWDDTDIGTHTQVSCSDKPIDEPATKKRRLSLRESRYFARQRSLTAVPKADTSHIAGANGGPSELPSRKQLMYARKPGSLRRAESLRSELSAHEDSSKHVPALHPSLMPTRFISSGSATPTSNAYAYVPTEPSTPVAHSPQLLPSPLPIVAPPPFELIPREPLSDEDAAERRLRILLVKEKLEREADGLSCDDDVCLDAQEQENVVMWTPGDGGDDVDEEGNSCVGACFDADGSISDSESGMFEDGASDGDLKSQDSGRDEHHEETRESKFSKTPELALGLEDDFRRKVVEWIIDVLPPVIPTKRHFCAHLHDQLTTSDETRFHAAHVFTRYLLRLGRSPASSPGVAKPSKSDLEQEGQKALIWDIALACVALCVKFHRDALFPLYIILTNEFLALAPHALTDEDLETAQRDVFEALSFSLGSTTPAAFMQELWHALPSLRALLSFDDGWAVAQAEAWAVLLEALLEPDVFRFPVSLLTAAALLDGVEEAVIRKRSVQARGVARNDPVRIRKGAVRASKTVVLDVLEVLGYVEEDLACCRRWLHSGR